MRSRRPRSRSSARAETGSSSCSSTRRYWNQNGPWGLSNGDVYTDYGLQNVWDVTRAQPYAKGILVNYSGGKHRRRLHAIDAVLERVDQQAGHDLREHIPQAARDSLPGHHAALERQATPVHPVPRPEPALLVLVLARRAVHRCSAATRAHARSGQIHFAGEHCSTDLQGFMEGGAAEGVRAANEILGTK